MGFGQDVRSGVGGASDVALCFGVCWEVLWFLGCTWDFGVGFGRCFVYCGFGRVDFMGRVEKWGKSVEGVRM